MQQIGDKFFGGLFASWPERLGSQVLHVSRETTRVRESQLFNSLLPRSRQRSSGRCRAHHDHLKQEVR